MKNKIFWIIAIPLIFLFGFWVWCQRPGLPVDRVLPSHPLVFARLKDVEGHINQVIHSDFGKSIGSIDIPDVLSRNNFVSSDINDFKHWQIDLVKFWENPFIKKFLSKEASIAVYRKNNSYQLYITLRLTLATRIAELLGQLFHQWGDDVTVTQQEYQGRVINHISFKKQGVGLAYVRIRDLIIVAPESLGHLEEVVDVYQHRHEGLDNDASYNFVRQNAYPGGDGLGFVNFNLFSDLWRGEMDSRLTNLGYQTAAFPVYGLSYLPGEVSKYKIIIGLNEKFIPPSMLKTLACPAVVNDSLRLVPVNAIAYNWGGCYDFEQSWELVKEKVDKNSELVQSIQQFKHRLEHHFHINIRKDILPLLGHEIGGYLTDVDMQGNYPFPRILLFIKIQQRQKAEELLDLLIKNPGIALQNEVYNNVKIHYIPLQLGTNMDPGYGFLGDYLLIASSRQLLKRSIDAYNDSFRSIVSDDVIEKFSLGDGSKFHSVTLMKTAELSRRAQDFLGWIDKYLSGQVSMAAAYKQDGDNKKQELDDAIANRKADLILAQKKLSQLKKSSLSSASDEDPQFIDGEIENLSREEENIRGDIANYIEQKEDLTRLLENYAIGAQTDKLTMYNMENVISPVLKGLESIDAQAVTVRFGNKILETEFLVK